MRRRTFLGGSTAIFAALLFVADAAAEQLSKLPVIGFLSGTSPEAYASRVAAFQRGLEEAGFVEDRNVAIEYRWAEGHYDRLPAMVADLVDRRVSMIAAITTPAALAAKAATATIPIVFEMGTDPVEVGLAASLNRPGGNLTGVSLLNVELAPKRLELLHELVPTPIIGLLVNPNNRNAEIISREVEAAARTLGLILHVFYAGAERDFDTVLADIAEQRVGGLAVGSDPFFNTQSERLAKLFLRRALPAIYQYHEFAAAGGLMSYGGNISDPFRQAGIYAGRILAGEKPAELPVVQSTRVELIINLNTAKALGLTVPPWILGRADELIE
jgi:putative tryptophan/tyrosine transport system substrate-binding protein